MNTYLNSIFCLGNLRPISWICVRPHPTPTTSFLADVEIPVTKATSGVIRNLLYLSPTRNLLYLSDLENGQLTGKFEHLACFFPGLLALGASTLNLADSERQLYLWAAEGLGHSCWIMYADQASGLGPELAIMDRWPGDWKEGRWIDQVEQWQRSGGAGGKPPGVKDLAPPVHGGRKDYYLSVGTYLSRPEVCATPLNFAYSISLCRHWRACLSFGARPKIPFGVNMDGRFGMP